MSDPASPTPASLTPASLTPASLTPAQRALLEQRLRGAGRRPSDAVPPVPGEPVPVSAEQRQIVFHTYLAPGNPVYNEAVTIIRHGELDVAGLGAALNALVARHDVWRTTFRRMHREPHQVVAPPAPVELPFLDLRELAPAERDARAAELVVDEAVRPYDLKTGPLLRPLLVRITEHEHRLYLAMHHIVFDGVCLQRTVLPELIALYGSAVRGEPAGLPDAVQYTQYAQWQRGGALDEQLRRHLPYWRALLQDAPTLALPVISARPAEPRYRGAAEWFALPPELVADLTAAAAAVGGTVFHALVAGYARLLQSWSGQQDIVLSTVADLRRRHEFEAMVGYCLTPVPLRLRFTAELPAREAIALVRGELLDALSHTVPFERLVDDLKPEHEPGSSPIFQTQIVLEPPATSTDPDWELHQLDPRIGRYLQPAKNDIQIELEQRADGCIAGRFVVNADLFDEGFGARAVAEWAEVLRTLARDAVTGA